MDFLVVFAKCSADLTSRAKKAGVSKILDTEVSDSDKVGIPSTYGLLGTTPSMAVAQKVGRKPYTP
ncbi:MAG: hypothetical protein Q9161_007972 [Pseudevernia consocians]